MKVILKEKIENLGSVGELVTVKDGFARNFLLPKGKALKCTPRNIKYMESQKKKFELLAIQAENEAREHAKAIEGIVVIITKKAGVEGKLFGSVSIGDIVEALAKQNVIIDKKKVLLSEPIKYLGEHKVHLRLYPEIEPAIKIVVEGDTKEESIPEKSDNKVSE